MTDRWDFSACIEHLKDFRDQRDWKQFHRPKELAAAIAIEAAELQEQFLWKDPETTDDLIHDEDRLNHIRGEIADVGIYLVLLTDALNIDLRAAIEEKIQKNEQRYPVASNRGIAAKTTDAQ